MKKIIVYAVSTTILLNSFQIAMAEALPERVKAGVNQVLSEKEILAIMNEADSKTTEELLAALTQVRTLMDKLNEISSVNESDKILKYANQLQIVLVGLSTYTMHSQLKSEEAKNATLVLNVATLAVNSFISHYKENHKVDATFVSRIIFETSHTLAKSGNLTPEVEKITGSLNTISSELLKNQSQISSIVTNLGGTQDVALLASFSYLLLRIVYPKVAKQTDGFFKNVLPKIHAGLDKAAEVAKKPVMYGTNGASGVQDILSMTLGLSSADSQKLILQTLINLDNAANKLDTEIKSRKIKK